MIVCRKLSNSGLSIQDMTGSLSDLREFEQKSGGVVCLLMPSERHVCCMELMLIGDENEDVR